MPALVLDASAAVEIVLWTPDGARLAAHVATADALVVPDHFHLECASALRRMQLHHEITVDEAQTALGQVLALRVRRVDTAPLLEDAWDLRHNITVADGLYVVLARRLEVALVTGDIKLTRAPKLEIPVLTAATPQAVASPPEDREQTGEPGANEQDAQQTFIHVYLHSGWMRTLPEGAVAILAPLSKGPLTRAELDGRLRPGTSDGRNLNSAAWDPLHEWTDEESAEHHASFVDTPFAATEDDPETAAQAMADEAARRQEHVAEMDRYAAALGAAPVRTLGDLVDFMVAARVLLVDVAGCYTINLAAPLPAEVLPLTAEEVATQDQMRWQDLHYATAQAVIRLFDPDAQRRDRLRTSVQKLARQVDAEVESVRAAVVTLLDEGDLTANVDVVTVREHQVFELAVDWGRFTSTRIAVRAAPDDPASVPGLGDPKARR